MSFILNTVILYIKEDKYCPLRDSLASESIENLTASHELPSWYRKGIRDFRKMTLGAASFSLENVLSPEAISAAYPKVVIVFTCALFDC